MIIILSTVAVILIVIAYSLTISLNSDAYYSYISKSNYKLSNRRLAELLNRNAMSNIPNIIINSKNPTVCSTSFAIFLSKLPDSISNTDDYELHNESTNSIYDSECQKICPNSSLLSLVIRDRQKQEIFADNKQLYEGIWCVSKRPRCNLRTTYAIMTMNNDAVCRSKFPNFFAGPEGNKIIACNNFHHYHPDNILIDGTNGLRVDPRTVNMYHEDELLDPNDPTSFRFRCQFKGTDSLGNKYIQHPLNRLHPMQNPCTMEIPNAASDYQYDSKTGTCECRGRGNDVGNRIPGDKKTPCTSCRTYWEDDKLTVKESCFPTNSVYTEARHKMPCFIGQPGNSVVPCMMIDELVMKKYNLKDQAPSNVNINMPLFLGDKEAKGQIRGNWIVYTWGANKWRQYD